HLDKEPQAPASAPATVTAPGTFTAAQRAQVDKVSGYLSSMQQLVGNFVQVGPDGGRVKGEFYMQKPGKIRFEYEPPSPIETVAVSNLDTSKRVEPAIFRIDYTRYAQ